jgi:hypothetical protein
MKRKVRGRRKTRENATRSTTSMRVFKELAEAISSNIQNFEMKKYSIANLSNIFEFPLALCNVYLLSFFKGER